MISQRKMGAALSYIGMFISIIIGIINIPLILSFVSQGDFGVYTTAASLLAVMSIMDFGLAAAITRFYSKARAVDNIEKQENTLATGALIYGVISIIIIIVGIIIYPLLDPIYGDQFSSRELMLLKQMFVIMVINFVISISTNVYNAALISHEKFIVLKVLDIVKAIINPILIFSFLTVSPNIIFVVISLTIVNVLAVIFRIIYASTKVKIKIKLHYLDKKLLKAMGIFSFFIFLSLFADKLYWEIDSSILPAVAGSAVAAVFAISATINRYYLYFSSNIASVFLPKMTEISARTDDMTEINEIFIKIGRIQFILLSLILSGFVIFGQEFIIAWLRDSFNPSYLNAYHYSLIILFPMTIMLVQNTGVTVIQAKNKQKFRTIVHVCIAIINVAATIPLAKAYGGYGCAIATGVAHLIGEGIIINIHYEKDIGLHVRKLFKQLLFMLAPILLVAIPCYFINLYIKTDQRIVLLSKIIIYAIIYYVVMYKLAFNEYEKNNLGGFIRKSRKS